MILNWLSSVTSDGIVFIYLVTIRLGGHRDAFQSDHPYDPIGF